MSEQNNREKLLGNLEADVKSMSQEIGMLLKTNVSGTLTVENSEVVLKFSFPESALDNVGK